MTPAVRKAVIPAAGLGTRFLPATKAQPKEMLPVVDRPAIQYVVEEAVAAGIDDILIITGRGKRSIEDHFDRVPELEYELQAKGKEDDLAAVRRLTDLADIHFVRQGQALGLGHAVAMAHKHVGDEPFAVMLGDDIMVDDAALLRSMIDIHDQRDASVLALLEVPMEDISAYGCVAVDEVEPGLVQINDIVEKPAPEVAPSNLAVVGRYVLTPDIFDALDGLEPGFGGEIQLTDAIEELTRTSKVYGRPFDEGRYDIGKKIDFLRATVEIALSRDDLGAEFGRYLDDLER